jgi:hypothetical protein
VITPTENKLAKRPVGITILAALLASYSAFLLVALILAFGHPHWIRSWVTPSNGKVALSVVVLSPMRMILAAILAVGLWRLQDWARHGTVLFGVLVLSGRTIAATVVALWTSNDLQTSGLLSQAGTIRILIFILFTGYLYLPRVASAFSNAPE